MKNKITYYLFNVWVVLAIGIVGIILYYFDNDITYYISLVCLSYVSIVVIIETVVGFYNWISNGVKNLIDKS